MKRDLRDPEAVGNAVRAMRRKRRSLTPSECADLALSKPIELFHDEPGPVEKYGDPRLLPTTA